jgi:hypothetical protein
MNEEQTNNVNVLFTSISISVTHLSYYSSLMEDATITQLEPVASGVSTSYFRTSVAFKGILAGRMVMSSIRLSVGYHRSSANQTSHHESFLLSRGAVACDPLRDPPPPSFEVNDALLDGPASMLVSI